MYKMIDEHKLIEYMRNHNYLIFQDDDEHSIDGIIERFKDDEDYQGD